ncbi:MAG: hypothetical protein OJF60_001813 [Burkholderiaceae bacterium]|nr:MAG: hypothetical protein OJF60_001813 [Burkholderiaceae bacterium]
MRPTGRQTHRIRHLFGDDLGAKWLKDRASFFSTRNNR